MENKKYIEELDEWFEDDADYSEYASDLVDEYCEILMKEEGMTRPIDEGDPVDVTEPYQFMWTRKAQKKIEAQINHYYALGIEHWPDGDIEINPSAYREI